MKPNDTSRSGTCRAVEDAAALPAERRRDAMTRFFGRFPGTGRRAPGLGRALIEFQDWEIDSGRVPGSRWWSAVNGLMVADIEAASVCDVDERSSGIVAAWARFAGGSEDPQRSLWVAHQASLERAVDLCEPLLSREPAPEQRFAAFVLALVRWSSSELVPTDGPLLDELTRRHYPPRHPITTAQWEALEARFSYHGGTARPQAG